MALVVGEGVPEVELVEGVGIAEGEVVVADLVRVEMFVTIVTRQDTFLGNVHQKVEVVVVAGTVQEETTIVSSAVNPDISLGSALKLLTINATIVKSTDILPRGAPRVPLVVASSVARKDTWQGTVLILVRVAVSAEVAVVEVVVVGDEGVSVVVVVEAGLQVEIVEVLVLMLHPKIRRFPSTKYSLIVFWNLCQISPFFL